MHNFFTVFSKETKLQGHNITC